ncbi:MAG: GlsB/YeaQ/YmgE family stress response membrane protein, partial [Candidatus Sulfotelmatobacter sp.]
MTELLPLTTLPLTRLLPSRKPGKDSSKLQEDCMLTNFIWWIIVGLIAGWAAGKIMKGGGYGAVMDIVLGIIGAVVGGWLLGALGI